MGTIAARKRGNGTAAYTAQIRLKRGGKVIHTEAQTFDRKADAAAWMKRRETQLSAPGALEKLQQADPTLSEVIARYLVEYEAIRPLGKTKRQCLNAIAAGPLGELQASAIGSAELVNHARRRILEDKIKPVTVGNDLAHLGAVFSVAKPAWGYPLDITAIKEARAVCKKMGMVAKSSERSRRPTLEELDKIMTHFGNVRSRRPDSVPMQAIIAFAIFSSRRQEEILRIRWADMDVKASTILVRDMKNPGDKWGNDVVCTLPAKAMQIIQSRPRLDERVFPYSTDAVSAAFTRACKLLGIKGLTFHDLRREAISHLFEMGEDVPYVSSVSAHRGWDMMRRYTALKGKGDKYKDWPWFDVALRCQ